MHGSVDVDWGGTGDDSDEHKGGDGGMKLRLIDLLNKVGMLEWVRIYEKRLDRDVLLYSDRTHVLQSKAEQNEYLANREVLLIRLATAIRVSDAAVDDIDAEPEEVSENVLEVVIE